MLRLTLTSAVLLVAVGAGAAEYKVGRGLDRASIATVPWEQLLPGDVVLIHAGEQPYAEKWAMPRGGTPDRPIIVRGVPDATGGLPIITGKDAVTRRELRFAEEDQALLVISADHVVIEGLHFREARQGGHFSKADRSDAVYAPRVAGVLVTRGKRVEVRGCELEQLDRGMHVEGAVEDLLVEHNVFHDNSAAGVTGGANLFIRALRPLVQHNDFGAPLSQSGDSVVDGSAGLVFRYNRVIAGNRLLAANLPETADLRQAPEAARLSLYGNVMVKQVTDENHSVIYVESPADAGRELQLHHNTFLLERQTAKVVAASNGSNTDVLFYNNVVQASGGAAVTLAEGFATLSAGGNWLRPGTAFVSTAVLLDAGVNVGGTDPLFRDPTRYDLRPKVDSPLVDAAPPLPPGLAAPTFEPGAAFPVRARADDGAPDLGAHEWEPEPLPEEPASLIGWSLRCAASPALWPLGVALWLALSARSRTAGRARSRPSPTPPTA